MKHFCALAAAALIASPAGAGTIFSGPSAPVASGPASGDLSGTYPSPTVGLATVTPAKMGSIVHDTVLANPNATSASPQPVTLPSCSGSPLAALQYTAGGGTGAFTCGSVGSNPQFPQTGMFTAVNAINLTGSGWGGCVGLTAVINNVTVVPAANDSVCLPAAAAGEVLILSNQSPRAIAVFPQASTTDVINGGATGASVNVSATTLAMFTAAANGKWQVTVYVTGTSGDILTYDSTGNPHDGGLLTGDCTSVALAVSCTNFMHVLTLTKPVILPGYTVSTLPSNPGGGRAVGALAYVTDATSCTFMGTVTGGGTTYCPVTYTGSAWVAD